MAQLHSHARDALAPLLESIEHAAVVVFGSAVRSDYRPGVSDINVMLALSEGSLDSLLSMGEPLRAAWRRHRVSPYIVQAAEVPRLADAFPMRIADMQRSHVVLQGDDPLAGIEVDPEHLRIRVEQELRNRLIRTRRKIVLGGDDVATLEGAARDAGRTLRLELWALLVVCEKEPAEVDHATVFEHAKAELDLDVSPLAELDSDAHLADPAATLERIIVLLEAAVRIADRAGTSQ